MSELKLRLAGSESSRGEATWSIESPTPGVVLIDVNVVGANRRPPLHWRTGTWQKPPLDISLDREGRLIGFQFVLQDERVKEGVATDLPAPKACWPIFDVANWPKDRYLDDK